MLKLEYPMAADALAPCVARTSATMIFTIQNKLSSMRNDFSHLRDFIVETCYIMQIHFYYSQDTFSTAGNNVPLRQGYSAVLLLYTKSPINMLTVFTVLCFIMVMLWDQGGFMPAIYSYSSGLLQRYAFSSASQVTLREMGKIGWHLIAHQYKAKCEPCAHLSWKIQILHL